MEIYVLDKTLTRIDLIEEYKSFIWTIRFNAYGDFVLVFPESVFPYSTIKEGFYLEKDNSNRLMRIETISRTLVDDLYEVRVTGRSLESYFEDRLVTPNTEDDYWTLTGSVGWIATELVRRICIDGVEFSPSDVIPNLRYAEQDASTETMTAKIQTKPLYQAIQEVLGEDRLGFRVFFDRPTKNFVFRVYRGFDRTVDQTVNEQVIFSESLDTLSRFEMLRSSVGYKNVAYVSSGTMIQEVSVGAGSGVDRRVIYVDAGDIKNPTASKLRARGRIELAKHNRVRLFSGEVEDTGTYRYEVDYEIGDTATVVDETGARGKSQITEFVTTYDQDGYRAYPTFSAVI